MRKLISIAFAMTLCAWGQGCESDSSDDIRARQDAVLKDPFGYGPDADDLMNASPESPDRSDITGGDIGHFDRDAMNRDLKSVFDP
jgi:hypothetical protein